MSAAASSGPGVLDTGVGAAYRWEMSENPARQDPAPDETEHGGGSRVEPLSTEVDPDFIPDADPSTPEEKTAREKPEETGS